MSENPIIDRRRPPFCYQTHDALDALAAKFTGQKLSTARSIYVAFTETANRNGGEASRAQGFRAGRAEIAKRAGVSTDTLDRYAHEFVKLNLLEVERQTVGAVNLPNLWVLLDPPAESLPDASPAPPGRTGAARGSRTGAALRARSSSDPKKTTEEEDHGTAGLSEGDLPPSLVDVEGRNLALDALADVCGLTQVDPAYKLAVVSLNGRVDKQTKIPTELGIAHLAWHELKAWAEGDERREHGLTELYDEPWRWQELLERMIRDKTAKYRARFHDITVTPKGLRDWWLRLDRLDSLTGGRRLTPDEILDLPLPKVA